MRLFSDVTSRIDDAYLARAAVLALRGAGRTWPNPVVGCVVVRDGEIVGEGFHPRAGEPHAEIFALAQARERARGADAYVTLEPCNHHGRTPPCVDALIEAGVASVTIGMTDPNPVAAGGLERLRTAGIAVNVVADQAPFAEITLGWLKRMRTGLPLVTATVTSAATGASGRASGNESPATPPSSAR